MQVRTVPDPTEFLRTAGPLLMREEARHNLILGLATILRDDPGVYAERRLWVVEDRGGIVGAALQTPPHNLVLATPSDAAAIDALAAAIDCQLPGVGAARPDAERFAEAWTAGRAVAAEVRFRQGLYRLNRVGRIDRSPGLMRWATAEDEALVRAWWREFAIEALHDDEPDEAGIARSVEQRVTRQSIALWEVAGEPVSLAALQGKTPNGVRIGPVFTPARHRRQGFASSLVADLSLAALASGNRFCVLYTNLANATSNRIYQRIGYELLCEATDIGFVRRDA